jgi:hypothetical protein
MCFLISNGISKEKCDKWLTYNIEFLIKMCIILAIYKQEVGIANQ